MDINKIFSREALNKLRSPEKLDTLLPITTPINWMALIAIGILLFSVVLWSIFGAFTVKVDGMGMIMDSAGVVNVSHISDGKTPARPWYVRVPGVCLLWKTGGRNWCGRICRPLTGRRTTERISAICRRTAPIYS